MDKWILFAFGAFFSWGIVNLLFKVAAEFSLNYWIIAVVLYFVGGIMAILYVLLRKPDLIKVNRKVCINSMIIGAIAAGFSIVGTLTLQHAFNIGPGSLIASIAGLNMLPVVIASVLIFKEHVSIVKGIGVLLAFISLVLINIGG